MRRYCSSLRFAKTVSFLLGASSAAWVSSASHAAIVNFGNDVYLGNSATGAINSANAQRLQRFQAPSNMTVDRLHFQYNSSLGTSTQVFALQADNGSGLPNGVDLATASVNVTGSLTGLTASLSSSVSLTAGSVYHIVNRSANANSTNSATWRLLGAAASPSTVNTSTPNGVPMSGVATASSSNAGSSWSAPSTVQTSIWGVSNSSTGEFVGQPYSTVQVTAFGGNSATTGNRIWAGQRFKYLGESGALESLAIQARGLGGTLTDDVRVHVVKVASQGLDQVTPADPMVITVVPGQELGMAVLFANGTTPATSPGVLKTAAFAPGSQPFLEQNSDYLLLLESASGGVMQLSFNQGSDTGVGSAFTNGNFEGLSDGFVLTSAEALNGSGLPSRLFTSDLYNGITGVSTYRDARFILNVNVPEPVTAGAMAVLGAAMLSRRRNSRV